MKIERVETFQKTIPLRHVTDSISHEIVQVFVKVTDAEGRVGLGEADTTPPTGPSAAELIRTLEEDLGRVIVGLHPLERSILLRSLEDSGDTPVAARCALDLALHDLAGKIMGVSAVTLFGGPCTRKVPLVYTLAGGPLPEIIEAALQARDRGFETVKFVVGEEPDQDLKRVAGLREAVGPDLRIRVCGRETYSLVTATRVLKRMEEFGLELVEQPLHRDNLEGMSELCSLLDTPVMATTAIASPADALHVFRKGAADILGVGCGRVGGLYPAFRIARMAAAAALPCCVSGLPAGSVGTVADLLVAAGGSVHGHAAEIPGPLVLEAAGFADPFLDVSTADEGFLMVPTGPGLGLG